MWNRWCGLQQVGFWRHANRFEYNYATCRIIFSLIRIQMERGGCLHVCCILAIDLHKKCGLHGPKLAIRVEMCVEFGAELSIFDLIFRKAWNICFASSKTRAVVELMTEEKVVTAFYTISRSFGPTFEEKC